MKDKYAIFMGEWKLLKLIGGECGCVQTSVDEIIVEFNKKGTYSYKKNKQKESGRIKNISIENNYGLEYYIMELKPNSPFQKSYEKKFYFNSKDTLVEDFSSVGSDFPSFVYFRMQE